jgi:hypothetical protein
MKLPRTTRRSATGAARCVVLAAACIAGLGGAPAAVGAQGDALTLDEIIDLRRRGVPTRRILRSVQDYCVAFTVNDSVERELVAVGADTILVRGIRQSCVVTLPMVKLPAGILLDDNFVTMSGLPSFTAPDRLCATRPNGNGLRMENRRLAVGCAIGYPFDLTGTNVRIELTLGDLQGRRGAMAALGFGKSADSWDQYSFAVTTDERFEACHSVGGRCQALIGQKRVAVASGTVAAQASDSTHIARPTEIRIAVEIRGRVLSFYIGDELVGTHTATDPITGSLSLGVGSRSSAVFKRVRVERIEEVATPQ